MKYLFIILFWLGLQTTSQSQTPALKFLQFNIWQEGTSVSGGFDAIVDEIINNQADIVTFSEVRNYKNTRFNERIVQTLKERGQIYYSAYSYDSGILSRFPIQEFATVFPHANDHGSAYKAIVEFNGRKIAVFTAHLDYLNAANYLPRGYDPNTWKKLQDNPITVSDVLSVNLASKRDEATALIIADAINEDRKGRIVILGIDFNEPSYRDWAKNTRHLFDHNGLVVKWQNSVALEKSGFIDAYRKKFPNPITHPGFTFPAFNKHVDIKKLIWAPDADDRDRIDFIYFLKNKLIHLKDIYLVGPNTSIAYGKPITENTFDPFKAPFNIWPTDHKAILAIFAIK